MTIDEIKELMRKATEVEPSKLYVTERGFNWLIETGQENTHRLSIASEVTLVNRISIGGVSMPNVDLKLERESIIVWICLDEGQGYIMDKDFMEKPHYITMNLAPPTTDA